jgi:hypothetical protein
MLAASGPSASAQQYVGNVFSPGSSLDSLLQLYGNADSVPPFVILQEYNPSGPATTGAIFSSSGTVNDITFYGGGQYDLTVYALAPVQGNSAPNELSFKVDSEDTISGDAATPGVQTRSVDFSVSAGDYLAFAGIGPYYPQLPNNVVGSDATYASSSEPAHYPTSFTAIPPTPGETFTVGAHGDTNATYEIVPNPFINQGRSYAIGVEYTPSASPTAYYLNSASLGQTNLSWSNAGGQSNWVDQNGAAASPPEPGKDVYITNSTGANASGPTVVNFDTTTDPQPNDLTIDSNAGGQLVELSQSANTLTTGSETIGTTGPAEHLQTGGINIMTGALTLNGFGTYDLQGGKLTATVITVNNGGSFYFDGGAANFISFNQTGGAVASGSSANPGGGSGTETIWNGGTFNQSGGTNTTGTLNVGQAASGGGTYNLSGAAQLTATNEMVGNSDNGVFDQSGGTNSVGTLTVAGTTLTGFGSPIPTQYDLSSGTLTATNEVIGGAGGPGLFTQSGGTNYVFGQLAVDNGGVYDLQGGVLAGFGIAINQGGQFIFDGGAIGKGYDISAPFTLNNGGTVTSNGNELIDHKTAFTQLGGTNSTSNLTIVSATSSNPSGAYDLQGGTLTAGVITVNNGGSFFFDGGAANFADFVQAGGTVASGSAANPGGGSGTETISAAVGGILFNQLGGTNTTGKLNVGQTGGSGQYELQNSATLTATNEMVGNGGNGVFTQSGGTNSVGTLTVAGSTLPGSFFSSAVPTQYVLSSGTLAATNEVIGGAVGPGLFTQSGVSTNNVSGILTINPSGTFTQTGGQTNVTGVANNFGLVTLGAGGTFSVGGAYTNIGVTLLEGGTMQATGGVFAVGGLFGGTGTVIGPVFALGGVVQIGASPDALHIEGAFDQTGGELKFEIDPDGKGGFLESSLVFDPGNSVSITGAKIVFDFLNGANPLAFFTSGGFNLAAFFKESDGSLFSSDFSLLTLFAGDTFATNMGGFDISGISANGAVGLMQSSAVPEPSTWAMLLVGFAGLAFAGRNRAKKHRL